MLVGRLSIVWTTVIVVIAAIGVAWSDDLGRAVEARLAPGSPGSADTPAKALAPAVRLSVANQTPPDDRIVGYFTSWGIYERNYQVADIPADRLSHLNYAFAKLTNGRCAVGDPWADVDRPLPTDDPSLPFRGNFNQLQVLKAHHPHLDTLLSVGGATWSEEFTSATATASGRRTLASSCVNLMTTYGFDGLDIDWEFPGPPDRANFTAFLVELRAQLDLDGRRVGQHRLLTIAGPAGAPNMEHIDIASVVPLLDWVNVMAYDFAGDWSPRTGHNAPLYTYPGIEDQTFTVDSAARRWVAAGAAAEKLTIGLAFYGRGFGDVSNPSPGASFGSIPAGTTQPGQFDYLHLAADVLPGMQITFDGSARAPFAYDPTTRKWISYDDARSIEEKGLYVAHNGFGGIMIWELSNDANNELLSAAERGLDG